MVSMKKLAKLHDSPESAARLRKRRKAETRLKIYGITAICLSGLALVALVWTVIGNAAGAVTEHYVSLPVTLDAEKIDPDGTGDPKVGAVARQGNTLELAGLNHRVEVTGGVMAAQCSEVLKQFFRARRA